MQNVKHETRNCRRFAASPLRRFNSVRRGSAMAMGIVVSVVITGLVVTLAWVAGMQAQSAGNLTKIDAAFYAAESGAQRVAWYCKNNKMASITSPISGTVNGYAYSTSWTTVSGNTIKVTSTGSLGSVSYTLSEQVTPPAPPIAAYSILNNFDNKNITVTGDVMTAGSYGNSGVGTLTGNLTYGAAATNTGSITGTITKGVFSSINFPNLDTTLRANALTKNPTDVFDFTLVGGANKVIYVNGDVTDPIVIGSGTLYVNGQITLSSLTNIGAAGIPVNLVATGSVTFIKNVTMVGSLYTPQTWTRKKVDLTGVVYVGDAIDLSAAGLSVLSLANAPWFDPRGPGGTGGSSTTIFTAFAGPLP